MAKNYYTSGGFNLICDVCGKKIKAADSLHRWDGLIVCRDDYEERHPQDFVRARQDKISIPFNRPRPVDVFRHTQGMFDSVTIYDDNDVCDYLLTYSDYFISDYIEDRNSFIITTIYRRAFADSTSTADSYVIVFTKVLSDSTTVADAASLSFRKVLTDTVNTPTEAASIFLANYIESGYFAADYVGTTSTF